MSDQADELRQLVLRSATHPPQAERPPRRVAVAGGKGGVGTTMFAVNLSIALSQQGSRIVLVDADLQRADVAKLCPTPDGDTIADVLAGRRSVHEALRLGPTGIQILPGAWAAETMPDCPPAAQQRLIHELGQLGAHADVIVLDVGNGLNPVAGRFWQAVDEVLLLATPDSMAIMDAYAAVKVLPSADRSIPIHTIINHAPDAETAREVHARIALACHRFLGVPIGPAGHVPHDEQVTGVAPALMVRAPHSAAAKGIERIAQRLLARWSEETKLQKQNMAFRGGRQSVFAA